MLKKSCIFLFSIIGLLAFFSCPNEEIHDPVAGEFWFVPANIKIANNKNFSIELHFNSGTLKIAAYGIDLHYLSTNFTINTDNSANGVIAGADGFVSAVNSNKLNTLSVTGFDTAGKGPGNDLHLLTFYFNTIKTGVSEISTTPNTATDEVYASLAPLIGGSCIVKITEE